jgi:aconitate decarboxylase
MEVRIPPLRYARHYAPEVKTGLRGKFAINYVVAMCILDGKLELATFTDEKVKQPQVQEAFSKVEVISDESIPEPGPYCPVTIELKSGARLSHTAKIAKGHPQNPMTENEILEKFRGNASLVISQKQADQVIAIVQNLASLDTVAKLSQVLGPS